MMLCKGIGCNLKGCKRLSTRKRAPNGSSFYETSPCWRDGLECNFYLVDQTKEEYVEEKNEQERELFVQILKFDF